MALLLNAEKFEEHTEVVKRVQAALYVKDLYSGEFDGASGTETKAAIGKFEAETGRAITGRITADLLVALGIHDATIFDEPKYLKTLPGNTETFKRIVQEVQVILYLYGYYDGMIDGIVGGKSRTALLNYQTDHGLEATGTITPQTLDALHVVAR
ncbi:hypothetical protein FF098_004485 [Parvularcula flava]|uniref:Peptidoglycan binding-like domain-containing protein n=1 Tax=Aquisalinus luteolus TaxID=1566827 RepID=A0ABX0HJL4_9PROT|nr:hypothetical protein [Aquisalinus luteolus]